MGAAVEVLGPPGLRSRMAAQACAMAAHYERDSSSATGSTPRWSLRSPLDGYGHVTRAPSLPEGGLT
jgi:hypothetical protein